MKRTIFTFFALATAFTSLYSESLFGSLFSIDIEPTAGLLNGNIAEYVVDEGCLNTNNIESRLDWDVKNIPYIGINTDVRILKHIYANFNGKFGFHKSSGSMEDYDWLNSLNPSWQDDDPTEITNYSISDNDLDSLYSLAFRLGATITLPFEISVSPFVSYEYDRVGFSAYGGTAIYKSLDYEEYTFDDEKLISYKQEINSVFLGVAANIDTFQKLSIQADFLLSPALTWIHCLDYHYLRKQAFYDDIKQAFQLKGDLTLFYRFSDINSLGISGFIQYIPFSTGTDYIARFNSLEEIVTDWVSTSGTTGGTERILWSISLVYRLSL